MTDDELPRVLRTLWGRDEPRRGPKPGRSIAEIADAAVRIADAQGLPAVSMSAVAAEVGLTTMALYRYVDLKQELIVAMADAAYGAPPARKPTGGWRRKLEIWASGNRDALTRHPWIVQIPVTDPPLAPNQLRWMERGVSAFAGTPLTEQQKMSSLLLVEMYVRGHALLSNQLSDAIARGTLSQQESDTRYVRHLAQLIDPDGFPGIHAALVSGSLSDGGDFAEDEFAFGLSTVLDGIEKRMGRRRTTRRAGK